MNSTNKNESQKISKIKMKLRAEIAWPAANTESRSPLQGK